MFYSKIYKEQKNINKFLISLTDQPPEKGIIRGKKYKNSINFQRVKGVVPAITFCDDKAACKKGDSVLLSCYYNKNQLSFQTKILQVVKDRIVIKKPVEISFLKQRISERYTPTPSDNIQFIIPSMNKTFKPLNIGIRGICIVSEENLTNNGINFLQCILKTDKRNFFVDCIFRNCRNDSDNYWKYNTELLFTDQFSFFAYLEWVYSLFQPNIYTSSRMSVENLKTCYENTRSTLIAKDNTRVKDIDKEIESWGQQNQIGRIHFNIAYVKNVKLVSACSIKRIYDNTFLAQRLVCIPGLHLYDKPKLKLYESLSEMLFHHPTFKYLLIYRSRDIEWHERFFQEVVNYAKDPSDINFNRLNFIDILINTEKSIDVNNIENPFFITPLLDHEEFFIFTKQGLPAIVNNAYNYSGSPNDTGHISELLSITGHSMVRKIYKITKQDKLAAFAVCEVYSDGYIINNSLDSCRIYYCADIKNHSKLLEGIIAELSLFYTSHQRKKIRIIWENRKVNIKKISGCDTQYKGTLLRLIITKQGLFSLHQASMFSEGKFTKYYHLSYSQQSILYLDNLLPNTTINTMSYTIYLKENAELNLLKEAINKIIQVHDSLRLQFIFHHGRLCQHITPFQKVEIPVIDFTEFKDDTKFTSFEKRWRKKAIQLYKSELFKFIIFRKSDSRVGIFLKMHHIITDGWTIGILADNILKTYDELKSKITKSKITAPSYLEFIKKDFNYQYSSRFIIDKKFWLEEYKDISKQLPITTPQGNTWGVSNRITRIINKPLAIQIIKYISHNKLSPFSFFISCLYIYLNKISGNKNIVIGTGVLNRSGILDKITSGIFVKEIPVKIKFDDDDSFNSIAKKVVYVFKKLLKHQKYPLELLLQDLRHNRSGLFHLYNTTFSYQNMKPNSKVIWHPYGYQTEPLNIHVNDREGKDIFVLEYDYQIAKYSEKEIIRMHEFIITILQKVIYFPEKPIKKLSIVPAKEKDLLLHTFNNTAIQYQNKIVIHHLFEKQVRRTPCNIAVVENEKKLTYDQLNRKANKLARFLMSIHTELQDEFIGILIENSIYQIIAQLGTLKSGNAFIPIDTETPKSRIIIMISDANIKTLITLKKHNDVASKLQWECPSLSSCIFLDTSETYIPEDLNKQPLMNPDLWDNVSKQADSYITASGWTNSYTGKSFSVKEMEEYGDNSYLKLEKYLTRSIKILEVGCGSGITMFRLAPLVQHYHGTDISECIIEQNLEHIKDKGITNISQSILPAHSISTIKDKNYDIVIINSVVQAFPGYNYLRQFIIDSIELINSKGLIFIGDIMDLDRKQQLIDSLFEYKKNNPDKSLKTKIDFTHELFVPKDYLYNLQNDIKEIWNVECTDKIHTIKNELTEYRYDTILHIDKTKNQVKYQSYIRKNIFCEKNIQLLNDKNLDIPLSSSSLAYAIFTSGTSGKPKGVMIEHKSVINLCSWYIKYYNISGNDNIGIFSPQSFDASVAQRFSSLISGATAHIIPKTVKQDPELLNEFITINNITIILLPTPFYNYFKHYDNKSLRVLLVGGDKLTDFKKRSYKVYNNYGPTENTVITTVFPVDKNYKNIPIGKPINNTRVYILDNNDNLMPIGISGELCISGDGLSRGYINNIDSDKFIDNPFEPGVKMYRTGDIARWLPDGNIEYIGRKDHQVKLRGFRIELEEIESVLHGYPLIDSVVVILKENKDGQNSLLAFYESRIEINDEKIIDFLFQKLPNYMIPSHFIHLPSIPLLLSGKIDRKKLVRIGDEKLSSAAKGNCFKSEVDKKLYHILNQCLIEDEITPDTRFSEMSGDSLKAIEISYQIEEVFQIKFSIGFLLDNPTFTDLADYIRKQKPALSE